MDIFVFLKKIIPNGLEKDIALVLLISLILSSTLSCSLDTLVKNQSKNGFKHLSQKFDRKVLDLVKQKRFYSYEYMCNFEKFNETPSSNNDFYSSLSGEEISNKEFQHFLRVWRNLK